MLQLAPVMSSMEENTRMDRRAFLRRASTIGITTAVAGRATPPVASGPCFAGGDTAVPKQASTKCLATEDGVMEGAPPPPDNLVTRENHAESQAKMRWAM